MMMLSGDVILTLGRIAQPTKERIDDIFPHNQ